MAIINYIPNVKTPTGFDTLNTVSQFTNHVATGVFTNVDTYEINVPAPNDILTGQFVVIFVPDTDSIVGMKISINNGTAIPIDGVGTGSLQTGVATSLLVDIGAGKAYQYFKDVDLTANNLPLTTGTADLYGLSGVDANVDKALEYIGNNLNNLEIYTISLAADITSTGDSIRTILSLSLPPGTYLVSALLTAKTSAVNGYFVRITDGTNNYSSTRWQPPSSNTVMGHHMSSIVSITATSNISFQMYHSSGFTVTIHSDVTYLASNTFGKTATQLSAIKIG